MPSYSRRSTQAPATPSADTYEQELAAVAEEQRRRMGSAAEGLSDYDLALEARWGSASAERTVPEESTPMLDGAAEEASSEHSGSESGLSEHDQAIEDRWARVDEALEASEHEAPASGSETSRTDGRTTAQDLGLGADAQHDPNAKRVSAVAMSRIGQARAAIAHTKSVLSKGAGNQLEALRETKFNSYFRMQAMRDPDCWELDPGLYGLASRYPDALIAAKAGLAKGGNCGEHAMVAFDYLRMSCSDAVNRVDVEGLDHAFVIIGNLSGGDKDGDLAVCDPWPTSPTACTWEDHFAFTPERSTINTRNSVSGDDADVCAALAAGLSLSAKGEAMIGQQMSEEDTEEQIKKGREGDKPWIWQHSDTTRDGPQAYRGPAQG